MSEVCVGIYIHGNRNYFRMGEQAILSVLEYSDFDIFVFLGSGPRLNLPSFSRIQIKPYNDLPQSRHRSERFLLKINALAHLLENTSHEWLILLDADAIFASAITKDRIVEDLADRPLGMVEQTTITGSNMTRKEFLDHYMNHSVAWISPGMVAPDLGHFRYYNAGVILGKRSEFAKFASWALNIIENATGDHQVGEHMIADQDYFQFWANSLHPGCCTTLPWYWNHCEYWDSDFPRPEALVLHFSNFCLGPDSRQIKRVRSLRKNGVLKAYSPALLRRIARLVLGKR